jgi:hypothetical protein
MASSWNEGRFCLGIAVSLNGPLSAIDFVSRKDLESGGTNTAWGGERQHYSMSIHKSPLAQICLILCINVVLLSLLMYCLCQFDSPSTIGAHTLSTVCGDASHRLPGATSFLSFFSLSLSRRPPLLLALPECILPLDAAAAAAVTNSRAFSASTWTRCIQLSSSLVSLTLSRLI